MRTRRTKETRKMPENNNKTQRTEKEKDAVTSTVRPQLRFPLHTTSFCGMRSNFAAFTPRFLSLLLHRNMSLGCGCLVRVSAHAQSTRSPGKDVQEQRHRREVQSVQATHTLSGGTGGGRGRVQEGAWRCEMVLRRCAMSVINIREKIYIFSTMNKKPGCNQNPP